MDADLKPVLLASCAAYQAGGKVCQFMKIPGKPFRQLTQLDMLQVLPPEFEPDPNYDS